MSTRWLFAIVGLLAFVAGTALWLANQPGDSSRPIPVELAPDILYAASFRNRAGELQPLGHFRGKVLVLNFWATWCTPCREEMPGLARVHARWSGRNVEFVGVAHDDPARVARFADEHRIDYPLLTGGMEVDELAQRLGDHADALPFTVIVGPHGRVIRQKVGAYSERELESILAGLVPSHPMPHS